MIPELNKSFTVYAFDYPGHGWSDIPKTDYTADYFVNSVEKYLEKLDLKDVLIAGVSIGGSIPLVIAGKNNNRVKGVTVETINNARHFLSLEHPKILNEKNKAVFHKCMMR